MADPQTETAPHQRPGRNDPCWCGSGRKYKRCHLDSDRAPHQRELLSEALLAIEASTPNFARRAMAPAQRQRQRVLARIGSGLSGAPAAHALRQYLDALEEEMRGILARRSRLFWMQTLRRRPPEPIGDSSPWTVTLYRRIAVLAALKYGSGATPGEMRVIQGTEEDPTDIVPADVTEQDVVDVATVEYLAYEFNAAAAAFRRVGKGADLVVINDDFRAVASEALEALIRRLDTRLSAHGSLAGSSGAAVSTDLDAGTATDAPSLLFAVRPNARREPPEQLRSFMSPLFAGPPNYMPAPLAIDEAREVLIRFDDTLTEAFGIGADALLASMWGLSLKVARHLKDEPRLAPQLFRTGYIGFSKGPRMEGVRDNVAELVAHWWITTRGESITHAEAAAIVEQAFNALTWTDESLASIDLWTRSPLRLLIDTGQHLLFDFAAMVEVVSGMFTAVGFIDGDPQGLKGRGFENEVKRRAAAAGFTTWHTGNAINSAGDKRDVDASFVVGTTLFLVEAKAFAQNERIDQGDFAALKGRWEKLHDKYLDQARTLKEFFETDRRGRNYAVPDSVTHIEYVLCTPAVEWIPSAAEELWLTPEIPRICTPDELLLVLTAADSA